MRSKTSMSKRMVAPGLVANGPGRSPYVSEAGQARRLLPPTSIKAIPAFQHGKAFGSDTVMGSASRFSSPTILPSINRCRTTALTVVIALSCTPCPSLGVVITNPEGASCDCGSRAAYVRYSCPISTCLACVKAILAGSRQFSGHRIDIQLVSQHALVRGLHGLRACSPE